MEPKTSKADFIEFLDYVAQKGLMPTNTAQARKAAAGKVLSVLSDTEMQDVLSLDLDGVMARFNNLHGKSYTPESLGAYKSRVRSALDDFSSYLKNPLAFKPSTQSRDRKPASTSPSSGQKATKDRSIDQPSRSAPSLGDIGPMSGSILPIPIRADLTVMIQGLPFDLTPAEAKKIAGVVQAMAVET